MELVPHAGGSPAHAFTGGAFGDAATGATEHDDATLFARLGLPSPPAGPVATGTTIKLGVAVVRDADGVDRACLRLWVEGGAVPYLRAELTDLDSGDCVGFATARGRFATLWPTIERLAGGTRTTRD